MEKRNAFLFWFRGFYTGYNETYMVERRFMEFFKEAIIIIIFVVGLYKIIQYGETRVKMMRPKRGYDESEKRDIVSRRKD